MKFLIERTSDFDGEKPPMKGCQTVTKYAPYRYPSIARIDGVYSFEANSLEELLAIVDREGEIIIKRCHGGHKPSEFKHCIEIYDDYRE